MIFRAVLLSYFLFLGAYGAYAQEQNLEEICKNLEPYRKTENIVGADYVPGVDVNGNKVVPADLGQDGAYPNLNPITIPIQIDLMQRYGLDLPLGAEMKPEVANLNIYADGRVEYNGQDISPQIKTMCENEAESENPHGQEATNVIDSTPKQDESKDVISGAYPAEAQK